MNHTCFPKENHLPYWAHRGNKDKKGDRVEPTGPPGLQRIMYQLSHLANTTGIWFLAWSWHNIYITCLSAGLTADTTAVCHVMPCHVMLVTLTNAYFTLSLHKVTVPCLVASTYAILNTSHASYWKAGAPHTPNPKILGNDMFHNGDTVPYRTTTIIHPPKTTRVHVKFTLYTTWEHMGGGGVRYGVNRAHPFRSSSYALSGVSFASFDFQMNFAPPVKFKIIFNIWPKQSSCHGRNGISWKSVAK